MPYRPAGRVALAFAFAAFAVHTPASSQPVANPAGLSFKAGTYRCELNRSVQVRQVAPDLQSTVIHWNKKDYTLKAVGTKTGALRYEDSASGLVWLVIYGKSILLDSRAGRQLANECKI